MYKLYFKFAACINAIRFAWNENIFHEKFVSFNSQMNKTYEKRFELFTERFHCLRSKLPKGTYSRFSHCRHIESRKFIETSTNAQSNLALQKHLILSSGSFFSSGCFFCSGNFVKWKNCCMGWNIKIEIKFIFILSAYVYRFSKAPNIIRNWRSVMFV